MHSPRSLIPLALAVLAVASTARAQPTREITYPTRAQSPGSTRTSA